MEVDWTGNPLYVTNNVTGEPMKACVFVASLPCSLYGYAEAFPDMNTVNICLNMSKDLDFDTI